MVYKTAEKIVDKARQSQFCPKTQTTTNTNA